MTGPIRQQLRVTLKARQSALEQFLRRRDGIAVERNADPSEEAQSALDRELTIRSLEQNSYLLHAIKVALQRLEDGAYGICSGCDGEISEKRLAALPWAAYCIACQEGLDAVVDRNEALVAASQAD
jgi:DnaK suppressor protein